VQHSSEQGCLTQHHCKPLQDLGQLESTYGRAGAQTIRSHCHTQIYFRLTDYSTASHLSRMCGKTSVEGIRAGSGGEHSTGFRERKLLASRPGQGRTPTGGRPAEGSSPAPYIHLTRTGSEPIRPNFREHPAREIRKNTLLELAPIGE